MGSVGLSNDLSPGDGNKKGFPRHWFTELSQKIIDTRDLECFGCEMVLRDAVQVTCGTRFCENCVKEPFIDAPSELGPVMCPSCEHDNVEDPVHLLPNEYQPDNFCRNQIKRLNTRCEHHTIGCHWTGKVFDREEHLQNCTYGSVVTCECGAQFVDAGEYERHMETGCSTVQSAGDIEQICTLKARHTRPMVLGARNTAEDRQAQSLPVTTSTNGTSAATESPAALGPSQYEALLNKYKANTSLIMVLFNEVKTCSHKLMSMDGNPVNEEVESLRQRVTVLETLARNPQAQSLPVTTSANGASAAAGSPATLSQSQYEALLNKYKANTNLITVLSDEVKTCSHKLMSMDGNPVNEEVESLRQRVACQEALARNLQSQCEEIKRIITVLFNEVTTCSTKLMSMGGNPVNCVQGNNTSGRLTWRIDNISQRMEEARTGMIPALYSQPFFTSDAGYMICACLYLNGDGIGKGSHVSLLFNLMKGPYDAILSWPFTHRVTMLLLDQSGQNNHVQNNFRPVPNSPSLDRPESEMSIVTRCPRFISKKDLDRRKTLYLKDNTMFIQIIVK